MMGHWSDGRLIYYVRSGVKSLQAVARIGMTPFLTEDCSELDLEPSLEDVRASIID